MNKVYDKKTKTEKRITQDIEAWLNTNSTLFVKYRNWYIGITNDPAARRLKHKNKLKTDPYFWKSFYTCNVRIASAIETHFHKKGMLESDKKGGVTDDSKYVYIFKKYPTILD